VSVPFAVCVCVCVCLSTCNSRTAEEIFTKIYIEEFYYNLSIQSNCPYNRTIAITLHEDLCESAWAPRPWLAKQWSKVKYSVTNVVKKKKKKDTYTILSTLCRKHLKSRNFSAVYSQKRERGALALLRCAYILQGLYRSCLHLADAACNLCRVSKNNNRGEDWGGGGMD
jgi:hypothetical protein